MSLGYTYYHNSPFVIKRMRKEPLPMLSKLSLPSWEQFQPTETAVLCFVRDHEHVLLIHKQRGLGKGKINGPGGRVEAGETPEAAAIRETREEVGLIVYELEHSAELQFTFVDGYALRVLVFQSAEFEGNAVETPEAVPFWTRVDEIPYEKMWADDKLWLPHVLDHRTTRGRFLFDGDQMLASEVVLE